MSADPVDYADTAGARHNRTAKARALAGWCWDRAVTPGVLEAASPAELAAAARAAGVNPPRRDPNPGAGTWAMVRELLDSMAAWAAEHPDHPDAAQPHARPAGCVCPPVCGPKACPACPACTPPAVDESPGLPRGWAALAALGPVRGRSCWCGEPAIRWVTAREGPPSWRCAGHPPQPGEWGASLDWSPRPCLLPLRCYCGRCDPPGMEPLPRLADFRSAARAAAAPATAATTPDRSSPAA